MKYGAQLQERLEEIPGTVIFLGYRGSIAHGTYMLPPDDIDLVAVWEGRPSFYLGLEGKKPTVEATIEREGQPTIDLVAYELRHFVNLLLKQNPNVLSALWLPEDLVLMADEHWKALVGIRSCFASKKAYDAFVGYAYGQLKRMQKGDNRRTQSAVRREYIEKYGYDVKAAAHLIRLLRMGVEFLRTGDLTVRRPDVHDLLRVKQGLVPQDEVVAEAERLFGEAERALRESELPEEPDRDKAQLVLIDLLWDRLGAHFSNKQPVGLFSLVTSVQTGTGESQVAGRTSSCFGCSYVPANPYSPRCPPSPQAGALRGCV